MAVTKHSAYDLRCEHRVEPAGIDEKRPRLSWKMKDRRPGAHQSAYHIVAASAPEKLRQPDLWDSGEVRSSLSLDVEYGGRRLGSRRKVYWRVRIANGRGEWSSWSPAASFSMGLLRTGDWSAKWITRRRPAREEGRPSPYLRREFRVRAGMVAATLYATARGCYECQLNGQAVGEDLFTPGWTDYNVRLTYAAHDVTDLLVEGANAWGVVLSDGWYAGNLGFAGQRGVYGDELSFLGQLEIRYEDGSTETVGSDDRWRARTGPLLAADHYDGETYDARLEVEGWSEPGVDRRGWQPVAIVAPPTARLVAARTEPVRLQETLRPAARTRPEPGVVIFDLGQNLVGSVRLRVRARKGTIVTLRYGEMLQADGSLYTANLRAAKCTDTHICRGGGEEWVAPRHTFHGFRYVEVTGPASLPRSSDLEALVWHSDMAPTGAFSCSHEGVNRLQQNIVWSQKGNFLEAPTDCPQRDERLGWTGDAQVFARTACFNYDVAAFFTKWCIDLEDSQDGEGMFPHVAPNVLGPAAGGAAAWADAGVICPYTIYLCYGDRRILERHFRSMKAWVRWQERRSPGYINRTWTFGDWLAIDIAEDVPGRAPTPTDLIATAYFAHTAAIVARVARILGRSADARRFSALATRVRRAFRREFMTAGGRLVGDTQTGYLLALGFDLLPAKERDAAFRRLVYLVESRGGQITTGFVGTPLIAPVLTRFGRPDLAYTLVLRRRYPSWLYTVDRGATTMWERWNSYTERGFGAVSMNSFNHYAYGAIGEWLYAHVAGIDLDPEEPGYRHIIFRPRPDARLRSARCSLETRYGKVKSRWRLTRKGQFELMVTVPPNTRGTVILPGSGRRRQVTAGDHTFTAQLEL